MPQARQYKYRIRKRKSGEGKEGRRKERYTYYFYLFIYNLLCFGWLLPLPVQPSILLPVSPPVPSVQPPPVWMPTPPYWLILHEPWPPASPAPLDSTRCVTCSMAHATQRNDQVPAPTMPAKWKKSEMKGKGKEKEKGSKKTGKGEDTRRQQESALQRHTIQTLNSSIVDGIDLNLPQNINWQVRVDWPFTPVCSG